MALDKYNIELPFLDWMVNIQYVMGKIMYCIDDG